MIKTTLREVKKGDFFTLKPLECPAKKKVYVRDDYNRSTKKYGCYKFEDINHYIEKNGNTVVYVDFIF